MRSRTDVLSPALRFGAGLIETIIPSTKGMIVLLMAAPYRCGTVQVVMGQGCFYDAGMRKL